MAGWVEPRTEGKLTEQPLVRMGREEGRPETEPSGVVFEVDNATGCDACRSAKKESGGARGMTL